jgi:hypothetical protein
MGNSVGGGGGNAADVLKKLAFLNALQQATGDSAKYGPRNFTCVKVPLL